MQNYRLVVIIGFIEIFIGLSAVLSNLITLALSINDKSPNVLLFVLLAGSVSTFIGFGMLKMKRNAYYLLLYFSSVIILSKILVYLDVIQLNGALEATVQKAFHLPLSEAIQNFMINFKRLVSVGYHGIIIFYLLKPGMKDIFHR